MANKFDHMEDSVRKAFEGFELPVSNTDWEAIAKGIESGSKRGLFVWLRENKGKWGIGMGLLAIVAGLSWYATSSHAPAVDKKTETNITENRDKGAEGTQQDNTSVTENQNPAVGSGEVTVSGNKTQGATPAGNAHNITNQNRHRASGNSTNAPVVSGPSAGDKGTITAPTSSTGVKQGTPVVAENQAPLTQPTVAPPTAASEPVVNIPVVITPPDVRRPTSFIIGVLRALGIRSKATVWPPVASTTLPLLLTTPKLPPNIGWSWYTTLQTNFDHSKANAQPSPASIANPWNGISLKTYRDKSFHLRLDFGLAYNLNKWRLGFGGAFEGTAATSGDDEEIHVKKVIRTFRYTTLQGDTIWWVKESIDTILRTSVQRRSTWIELPLSIERCISLGKNWNLYCGLTLNTGYRVTGSGSIANPNAFGDVGKEFRADPMKQPQIVDASKFMSHFRFGNGIQIGVEKQIGKINYGVQTQARYYYTPVWNNGIPMNQNTFNYGINFRIGVKL